MKEPIPKRPDWHSRRCSLGSPFTFRQGARLNQITSFTVLYWHANHKSGRFPYLGRCRISLAQCARMTRCQSARRDRRPCQQHIGVGLCIKGCLGFIDPPGMVSLYGELPRIPVLNACSPLVTFWLARSGAIYGWMAEHCIWINHSLGSLPTDIGAPKSHRRPSTRPVPLERYIHATFERHSTLGTPCPQACAPY